MFLTLSSDLYGQFLKHMLLGQLLANFCLFGGQQGFTLLSANTAAVDKRYSLLNLALIFSMGIVALVFHQIEFVITLGVLFNLAVMCFARGNIDGVVSLINVELLFPIAGIVLIYFFNPDSLIDFYHLFLFLFIADSFLLASILYQRCKAIPTDSTQSIVRIRDIAVMQVSSAMRSLLIKGDQLLVSSMLGPSALAVYSFTHRILSPLSLIGRIINIFSIRRLSERDVATDVITSAMFSSFVYFCTTAFLLAGIYFSLAMVPRVLEFAAPLQDISLSVVVPLFFAYFSNAISAIYSQFVTVRIPIKAILASSVAVLIMYVFAYFNRGNIQAFAVNFLVSWRL